MGRAAVRWRSQAPMIIRYHQVVDGCVVVYVFGSCDCIEPQWCAGSLWRLSWVLCPASWRVNCPAVLMLLSIGCFMEVINADRVERPRTTACRRHIDDNDDIDEPTSLSPYLLELRPCQPDNSGHHLLFCSQNSSRFIFCITCLFYSVEFLGAEFSSVCFLTRLLPIPLKDRTVLCRL